MALIDVQKKPKTGSFCSSPFAGKMGAVSEIYFCYVPEPLDVGCDPRDAVDPVREAVLLHESGAAQQDVRDCM